MKTLQILGISVVALIILSCSKDDDSERTTQTLLTKVTTNSTITTYQYDENNRATSYEVAYTNPANNYSGAYTYNDLGQLAEIFYEYASNSNTSRAVYFYNNSEQITKIETYMISGGVESYHSKTQADYTTLGKVSVYFQESGQLPYLYSEFYLDDNGNITRRLSYDVSGLQSNIEDSDFDDKNIYSASIPKTKYVRSVNNHRTSTTTFTGESPSTGTYTYEYNSDGYPTKRTSNTGSIVTFEYIKR